MFGHEGGKIERLLIKVEDSIKKADKALRTDKKADAQREILSAYAAIGEIKRAHMKMVKIIKNIRAN